MNKIMRKLIETVVLGVVIASSAWGVMSQTVATAMDKNRDGKIALEEYAVFYDFDFSRIDRGRDGVLTPEEFANENLFRLASIEWVHSNAGKYHFDMKRFGIGGASAGGHLSALAAQKTPGCIAYIGYCGGYDMVNRGNSGWPNEGLLRRFFGKTDEATLKTNSPIWQIRTSSPDALLLHGTADRTIDPDISGFAGALRSRGGTVKIVLLDGASHGICHQPEFKEQCYAETEAFLCRVFGGSPVTKSDL